MSKTRRNFSSKFKADLILEAIKGEKDIHTIAAENSIQPNLLRNWKKEFLEKANIVSDDTREEGLKEKLSKERKEKAAYVFKYIFERCHSSIGNVPPASVYYPALLYEAAREAPMPTKPLNAARSAA